ncbi:MAG: SRPBCC family protein [Flavobacteriales bacterium]|jgi:hypothetical protein|nr:SRPBCC family protein [Flavobacteriales bacterium]
MLLYILLGLAALLAILLIVASRKPDTVHYERSIVINASPERIIPHIEDFHKWSAWSPWEKLDPQMKREYSGAASGPGAKYFWSSTGKAGEGSMEIIEATERGVHIDLRFVKPFKNVCDTWIRFEPQGSGTRATWMMTGPNLFMGKLMGIFINMDKMVGKDFETGLAGMKAEVEKS